MCHLKHAIAVFALECSLESVWTSRHYTSINTQLHLAVKLSAPLCRPPLWAELPPAASFPSARRQRPLARPRLTCCTVPGAVPGATPCTPPAHPAETSQDRVPVLLPSGRVQPLTCMWPWYILPAVLRVPLRPAGWVQAGRGHRAALLCARLKERKEKKKSLTLEELFLSKIQFVLAAPVLLSVTQRGGLLPCLLPPLLSLFSLSPPSLRCRKLHRSCSSRGAGGRRAGPRRRRLRSRRAGSAAGRSGAARCRAWARPAAAAAPPGPGLRRPPSSPPLALPPSSPPSLRPQRERAVSGAARSPLSGAMPGGALRGSRGAAAPLGPAGFRCGEVYKE